MKLYPVKIIFSNYNIQIQSVSDINDVDELVNELLEDYDEELTYEVITDLNYFTSSELHDVFDNIGEFWNLNNVTEMVDKFIELINNDFYESSKVIILRSLFKAFTEVYN